MKDLYNVTASEAVRDIAEDVAKLNNISKKLAIKLVCNALIYNCVIEEVIGQVNFLLDKEREDQ